MHLFTGRSPALFSKSRPATCVLAPLQRRCAGNAAKDLPVAETPKGPNQDQLPHVSEEAAQTSEIMGEVAPKIEEHGTPVQEVASPEQWWSSYFR